MFRFTRAALAAAALSFAPFAHAQPLAFQQQAITCGTTSTTVLAAGAASFFVRIHVPSNAANGIFVNWAGAAATTSQPSEDIAPGGTVAWIQFAPSQAISCIASAATAVVVESR
jgi:hypothetical protein